MSQSDEELRSELRKADLDFLVFGEMYLIRDANGDTKRVDPRHVHVAADFDAPTR